MNSELLIKEIIDSAYKVQSTLGLGFLEAVYSNSLDVELSRRGILCEREAGIKVYYEGIEVGLYRADLIVEGKVIIENKVASSLALAHELQLVNYLKATGIRHGLLFNFGTIPIQIKRKFKDPKS